MIKKIMLIALLLPITLLQAMERPSATAGNATSSAGIPPEYEYRVDGATPKQKAQELLDRMKQFVIDGGVVLKDKIVACIQNGASPEIEVVGCWKWARSEPRVVSCNELLKEMEEQMEMFIGLGGRDFVQALQSRRPMLAQIAGIMKVSEGEALRSMRILNTYLETGVPGRVRELKKIFAENSGVSKSLPEDRLDNRVDLGTETMSPPSPATAPREGLSNSSDKREARDVFSPQEKARKLTNLVVAFIRNGGDNLKAEIAQWLQSGADPKLVWLDGLCGRSNCRVIHRYSCELVIRENEIEMESDAVTPDGIDLMRRLGGFPVEAIVADAKAAQQRYNKGASARIIEVRQLIAQHRSGDK